ncbi:MAG: PilZ domain-containing protein [Sandaracinaceae bacterium]|nr:PilZ domain-containing protein [Sandaracinaceae bacterium]
MVEMLPTRRRASARRHYRPTCRAIHWGRFELIGERLLEVSTQGCLLACDAEVRAGDELLLTFRMPWLGPHVLVVAEVVRVIEGRRDADPGYCAGLRFVDLDPGDRVELAERLAMLEPSEGARPHPIDYALAVQSAALELPAGAGVLLTELAPV